MTEAGVAPFAVLVVCTGNICRSPMAERLLRSQTGSLENSVLVHSAGTRSMVGHGMTPEATHLTRYYGADPEGHASQQLTQQLIADADLILTATREHRREVVYLNPRAARYTYTVNQFARLLPAALRTIALVKRDASPQTAPAAHLRALVGEVAATRGFSPPPARPDDDDIEDPYRQSTAVYARVGVKLNTAVTQIARGFDLATRAN